MIRRSSGELVAAHLRRMVFDGEYKPGDRVRQDEIAAELGVSRIPVREAIIALDREGWVTVEPHRGAFVRGIDADYVRDHYELYGLVFGLLAARVAERADDAGLELLLVDAAAVVAVGDDPKAFNDRNRAFLVTLEEVARAPRLTSMARVMTSLVPGNFFREIPGAIDAQRRGVAAVTEAIEARDPARASLEFRTLLRGQGEAVVALLESRGIFTQAQAQAKAAGVAAGS
jgi:DNA-binding GntR family transcriptional regulator